MGIVKVRREGSDNYGHQSSLNAVVDDLEQRASMLQENNHADDSDSDCEHAEVDCEFAKIGDQKCSVPYDLYDLTDLKEVLSLETWNSCLTEEERFSLSAYLPDMDQETFWLTMKELLNGENVFFGSPLEVFFQRLKGGFYSLKVAQFREALQCIHKRGYYHSLRLYHENMAHTFMDMKKAWSDCQPSIDVEERVRIWNKRRAPKPVCVVDLNAFPADEEVLTAGDKNVSPTPLSKKMKFADNRVMDVHASVPVTSGAALSIPKTKPKGVLKVKSTSKHLESSSTMQSLPCDSWGKLRPPPKGVLKIKPRSEPLSKQERPGELSLPRDTISVETSGLQAFRFSPPQSASAWDTDNVCEEPSFPHQKIIGGKFNGSPELPPFVKGLRRGQLLKRSSGLVNNLQNFERRKLRQIGFHNDAEVHCLPVKNFQKPEVYSHDINDVGNQNCENLGQHSGPWTMGLYPSTELDPSTLIHSQGRRQTPSLTSGPISRTSAVGAEESGSFGRSLDQLEHRHRDVSAKGLLKPSDQPPVAGVPREGFMLPLTYKRKKGHSKRNSLEHIQQPIEKANAETRMPNGSDSHLVEEAKSMKIKLKMWNAPDSQYKQGLLNGL